MWQHWLHSPPTVLPSLHTQQHPPADLSLCQPLLASQQAQHCSPLWHCSSCSWPSLCSGRASLRRGSEHRCQSVESVEKPPTNPSKLIACCTRCMLRQLRLTSKRPTKREQVTWQDSTASHSVAAKAQLKKRLCCTLRQPTEPSTHSHESYHLHPYTS